MNQETLRTIIALSLINGLGAQRISRLIHSFSEPARIFKASPRELMRIEGIGEKTYREISTFKDWHHVDDILKITDSGNIWLMNVLDDDYPEKLRHIYDPPVIFWGMGNRQAPGKPAVAVVGTRNPSAYGKEMTELFSRELAGNDVGINSGLAYGVDTIAHKTAVACKGITTAVLGSGIDWIYPASNKSLAQQIIESGGAVLSEFPPGTKPDAGNFPVRNRIVSGLSLGVLVVESAASGGSIITVNSALDQGREVFVIPHPLDSKSGFGCNELIKKGHGKLVQSVDDILNEIDIPLKGTEKPHQKPDLASLDLPEQMQRICSHLSETAIPVDDLAEKTGLPVQVLLTDLLQLELMGIVRQSAGKRYSLK